MREGHVSFECFTLGFHHLVEGFCDSDQSLLEDAFAEDTVEFTEADHAFGFHFTDFCFHSLLGFVSVKCDSFSDEERKDGLEREFRDEAKVVPLVVGSGMLIPNCSDGFGLLLHGELFVLEQKSWVHCRCPSWGIRSLRR